jgi:hypothetical protein
MMNKMMAAGQGKPAHVPLSNNTMHKWANNVGCWLAAASSAASLFVTHRFPDGQVIGLGAQIAIAPLADSTRRTVTFPLIFTFQNLF